MLQTQWPRNYESWPKFQIILCTFRLLLCITQQTQSTLWHHKTAFDCQTSPATPSTSMPSPWKGLRPRLDNIIHNRLWHLSTSIKFQPTQSTLWQHETANCQNHFYLHAMSMERSQVSLGHTVCDSIQNFFYASFDLYSTSPNKLKVHFALTCQTAVTTLSPSCQVHNTLPWPVKQ